MDELAALEAMGVGLDAEDHEPLAVPAEGAAPADAPIGDAEMEALAALAEPPVGGQARYCQRSWELGQHMTDRRLVQQAKRKSELQRERAKQLEQRAIVAALTSASAARASGARKSRLSDLPAPLQGAVLCRLACGRAERSDDVQAKRQLRAAGRVAAVAKALQLQSFGSFFTAAEQEGSPGGCGEASAVPADATTVTMFSHQFDTAKQRAKAEVPAATRLPGEEDCDAFVTVNIMMQQGHVWRCWFGADGSCGARGEPYFMEGTTVAQPNADFYLQSLLHRLPVNFEDGVEVRRVATSANWSWFVWTTDRDTNNALVVVWFFAQLLSATPPTSLPLAEACWLHGVQLAKDRYRPIKRCALEAISLSRQFRHASFRQGAREALVVHVRAHCKVRLGGRPDSATNAANALFAALFPDEAMLFLGCRRGPCGVEAAVRFPSAFASILWVLARRSPRRWDAAARVLLFLLARRSNGAAAWPR